jgi:hypothetical protein
MPTMQGPEWRHSFPLQVLVALRPPLPLVVEVELRLLQRALVARQEQLLVPVPAPRRLLRSEPVLEAPQEQQLSLLWWAVEEGHMPNAS